MYRNKHLLKRSLELIYELSFKVLTDEEVILVENLIHDLQKELEYQRMETLSKFEMND